MNLIVAPKQPNSRGMKLAKSTLMSFRPSDAIRSLIDNYAKNNNLPLDVAIADLIRSSLSLPGGQVKAIEGYAAAHGLTTLEATIKLIDKGLMRAKDESRAG